jgi:hypothetical protein
VDRSSSDQFTDCLGLTIGLSDGGTGNPLSSAIRNPTLGKCSDAIPRLEGYAAGDGLRRNYDYFRYWHGYTVAVRSLVASFGLRGTRVITAVVLVAGILGLGRSIGRRHGLAASIGLLAPFVLTTDFGDLPLSLPHAYGVAAILGSCWFAYAAVTRHPTIRRGAAVSMLSGAAVVYTDVLTTAPGGWALCVFVVTLASSSVLTGRRLLLAAGVSSVSWIAGYAWTWFTKWLLAAILLGYDRVRSDVGSQVSRRLDGELVDSREGFLASTRVNVSTWRSQPLTGVVVVGLVVLVSAVWIHRSRNGTAADGRLRDRAVLALPAIIPVLWYELLRNHSQTHYWFTYRSVSVAVGVVAAALLARMVPWPGQEVNRHPLAMLELEDAENEAGNDELSPDGDGGDRRDDDSHRLRRVESLE